MRGNASTHFRMVAGSSTAVVTRTRPTAIVPSSCPLSALISASAKRSGLDLSAMNLGFRRRVALQPSLRKLAPPISVGWRADR